MTADKVRENRIRRMADRQGYRLEKSRRRDRRALDYGLYRLVHFSGGVTGADEARGLDYALTLDQAERWLTLTEPIEIAPGQYKSRADLTREGQEDAGQLATELAHLYEPQSREAGS